jgi:hypothetical protein
MRFMPQLGLAVVTLGLLAGCAQHYKIVTNSGGTITARGKPVYDKKRGVFFYKDGNGLKRSIPAGGVSQIAPASATSSSTGSDPK